MCGRTARDGGEADEDVAAADVEASGLETGVTMEAADADAIAAAPEAPGAVWRPASNCSFSSELELEGLTTSDRAAADDEILLVFAADNRARLLAAAAADSSSEPTSRPLRTDNIRSSIASDGLAGISWPLAVALISALTAAAAAVATREFLRLLLADEMLSIYYMPVSASWLEEGK
jgi:hypothetical protein